MMKNMEDEADATGVMEKLQGDARNYLNKKKLTNNRLKDLEKIQILGSNIL